MKNILILIPIIALTGCSTLIDAYLMKYDPNEYQQITQIRSSASFSKEQCDNVEKSKNNAELLAKETTTFKNYAQYLPHNNKVISASVDLDKIAQGLKEQYNKGNVSSAFCKIKFDIIEKSAETMQKTIGAKPR